MKRFVFDVQLGAVFHVPAATEAEARELLGKMLHPCVTATIAAGNRGQTRRWPNGDPIMATLQVDGDLMLAPDLTAREEEERA